MAQDGTSTAKAKAAGVIAKGGGPENPVADVAAAGTYLKARGQKKKASRPGVKLPRGSGRRMLLAEFLICFLVLFGGTIVTPAVLAGLPGTPAPGEPGPVPRLVTKSTGLAALFLVLALISATGKTGEKFAAGLGLLVTLSYLFTSPDATNILVWFTAYFSKPLYWSPDTGTTPPPSSTTPAPTSTPQTVTV